MAGAGAGAGTTSRAGGAETFGVLGGAEEGIG
jgi:hypothetical protein